MLRIAAFHPTKEVEKMNDLLATYKPLFPGGIIVNPESTTIIYDDGADHPKKNSTRDKLETMLIEKEEGLADALFWQGYWQSKVFTESKNEKFMTNHVSADKNVEELQYQIRVIKNILSGNDLVKDMQDFKKDQRMAKKNGK